MLSENQNLAMSNYIENISTNLENSRNCLRRIARHDDTEFSNQSVLNVMEKFVKTVNKMDETILVPCRLMDLKVGDEQDPAGQNPKTKSSHSVHQLLSSTDLFEIYNMLNGVKESLLWGGQSEVPEPVKPSGNAPATSVTTPIVKGHIRRPSSVSVTSTNSSSTLSDTDSESGSNEIDSGIDETSLEEGKVERIAQDFKRHLHGLTSSLRHMTEAAQYLTWRYQYDIGGPV
ncbi:mid1-interacting protein 1-like [Diorhabda sublineata]|uniref:mid1-interacting protein 1-like n=1 Tax=Diorhabda sublineata TaxID=1163346 RepID=UPI0024E15FCF|nr:mid1-interacting protein 1-like [Diorhabda sublineata]